jgi:hypothetical protein
VPGIEESKAQLERKLIDLFPDTIRRNTKELYPLETIYGDLCISRLKFPGYRSVFPIKYE